MKITITTLLLGLSLAVYGSYFNSVQNGDWDDLDTWEQDSTFYPALRSPFGGDTVIIQFGDTVTINNQYNFSAQPPMYIQVEGVLQFQTGKKLRLALGSGIKVLTGSVIMPGTGLGSSNIIEIDTVIWRAGDGPIFGPADLGTTPQAPLPVNWVGFRVSQYQNYADLHWQCTDEIDNDYFEVWRSDDLETFIQIGHVEPAKTGIYKFRDQTPLYGESYYKIKQVDGNGDYSFSNIVSFHFLPDEAVSIFPNPAIDYLSVEGIPETAGLHFTVLDMMGREQQIIVNDSSYEIQLDVNTLRPGQYILLIKGDNLTKSYRFNKQ
jgi:hypothetical protein